MTEDMPNGLSPLVTIQESGRDPVELTGAFYHFVVEYRPASEVKDLDYVNPALLADKGGAFSFWDEPGEDIYSVKES
jgi:hypothetical protein